MSAASVTGARRVEVKVTINGHDATGHMDSSLLDLSCTDNPSGKADDLQITLQVRDGN